MNAPAAHLTHALFAPWSRRAFGPWMLVLAMTAIMPVMNLEAVAGPPNAIIDAKRTAGGKMSFAMAPNPNAYFILHRRSELASGPGRAVAIVNGSNATTWFSDSVFTERNRDVFHVNIWDKNTPGDADGDSFSELLELAVPGRFNPFNPAPPIDPSNGLVQIPNRAEFERLSNRDNRPGAQSVREVKFLVYNVHTASPELYFAESNQHQFHFGFTQAIGRYTNNTLFNNDTYFTNTNRKNLAGSLVSHDNYIGPDGRQGMYTVEFWPTDPVAFGFVETAYEMIAAAMPYVDGNIAYHPASETQRERMTIENSAFANSQVNSIATETLFSNVNYTGLNEAEAFGRLRLVTGAETLSVRDIVIFRSIPNDLTHVAGIMTEIPQTPLSHINLKAKQNNTPNAFIAEAASHPEIAPLLDQNVYYRVGPDGFEIRAASQAEVDAWFDSIRPDVPQSPARNLSVTNIPAFAQIGFGDADAFGSKTANLAELHRILPQNTPDGFAVPFYFYDEFMKHNGFYTAAAAMIADPLFQNDAPTRELRLSNFRTTMKNGTLPGWMLNALGAMHAQFPAGSSVRARSSTNNEDLEGFSGAGLYSSFTHKVEEGHFQKSAKQVWASLWNYRAYEEREFWRIDHMAAAMGILVHPNFKDEQANGVGVTKNIYDPRWRGHYINVQLGEDLVTNPDAESVPEEFLISSLATANYEIQYIRFSNQVPAGTTILSEAQAQDLKDKMNALHFHFRLLYGANLDPDWAMEIEFKITAAGDLSIKQARPWID